MDVNIVNLLSRAFTANKTKKTETETSLTRVSENPFSNPFVAADTRNYYNSYAKNKPVQGGYFAGYYNGRANVVGQRLFIEA